MAEKNKKTIYVGELCMFLHQQAMCSYRQLQGSRSDASRRERMSEVSSFVHARLGGSVPLFDVA